jgi:hypothetical protein
MPYFLTIAEIFIDSCILRSAIALSIALIVAEISHVEVLLLSLIKLCMTWVAFPAFAHGPAFVARGKCVDFLFPTNELRTALLRMVNALHSSLPALNWSLKSLLTFDVVSRWILPRYTMAGTCGALI